MGRNSGSPKTMGLANPDIAERWNMAAVHIFVGAPGVAYSSWQRLWSNKLKRRTLNMIITSDPNKNASPLPFLPSYIIAPAPPIESWRPKDTVTPRNETRKRPQLHLITEALGPRCRQRGQGLHRQAPARRSQLDAEDVVASLEEELKRHFSRAHAWRV